MFTFYINAIRNFETEFIQIWAVELKNSIAKTIDFKESYQEFTTQHLGTGLKNLQYFWKSYDINLLKKTTPS